MNALKTNWRKSGLVLLLIGMFIGGAAPWVFFNGTNAQAADTAELVPPKHDLETVQSLSQAFRFVAEKVGPAVVRIETTVEASDKDRAQRQQQFESLPKEWRDFFENQGGGNFSLPDPTPRESGGSGVVIDADAGLIVTNNHVIEGAKDNDDHSRISVFFKDGRRAKAEIVGADPKTDLALIRVHLDHLRALTLGDSDASEVGDWVLAIGAPFGYDQTVTQGIISAKERSIGIIKGYEHFLQTDAAINPGNSGGPLVNMRGEVIGINTAIATNGMVKGYMGIGFAVPSSTVKDVLPDLKEGRKIVRGYLGARFKDLSNVPGMAKALGLKEDSGLMVDYIFDNTPAEKAGLQHDDVVQEVDGKPVKTFDTLQRVIARTEPGTEIKLKIWRNEQEIIIPVTIEEQPDDFFAWNSEGEAGEGGNSPKTTAEVDTLGLTVTPMTAELAKKYGWDDDDTLKNKLIVTEVQPVGDAWALGIRAGDVILEVQRHPVKTVQELKRALSKEALRDGVLIRVQNRRTGPTTRYLKVE
jgi:serine protease Do